MNSIKIDQKTIKILQKVIVGNDETLSPYRSGPDLVEFFNQFGFNEEYGKSPPSRPDYAKSKISDLNGTSEIIKLIEDVADPRHYFGEKYCVKKIVEYLNQCLELEGCKLEKVSYKYKLHSLKKEALPFDYTIFKNNTFNIDSLKEVETKCKARIKSSDYDGAITSARTFLETTLLEIIEIITDDNKQYDGNLNKLYKEVSKLLNLNPSKEHMPQGLNEILSGFISITNGISSVRNKMSDSHPLTYKPDERHAKLAVNSIYTVSMFLFESFNYQIKTGAIKPANNKLKQQP